MARIYQRKDIWYVDYKYKSRRYRKKIGTSKKLAETALKDIEIKIIKDELGFSKNDIMIESLIEKFLEYNRTNHRPRPKGASGGIGAILWNFFITFSYFIFYYKNIY